MGHGIAHAAVASGYETRLYDVSDAQLERAHDAIDGIFKAGVERGKVTVDDAKAGMLRLAATTDVGQALSRVGLRH